MRVADRVTDVADRVQTRRLESKRDTLDRDNERLRTELRSIKHELDRERSARDELLDALKKGEGSVKADKVKVKTKKRGGFLRLLVIGGGAYVLGTRAGHERYEQIKGWASGMKDRMQSRSNGDEWESVSTGMGTGSMGSGSTSGMSGSTGSSTGTGSTAGSKGSTSTGSTGSSTGSTPTGSTGSTSTGSTSTGSTSGGPSTSGGSTSSTSKRTGSSGSTSSS